MKQLKQFCEKYDATVSPSHQVCARSKPYLICSESDPQDFTTLDRQLIPMVNITMPQDRFRALIEHERWLQQINEDSRYPGHHADIIVREHEREIRARNENPAISRAYEEYQFLLKLNGF